MVTSSPEPQAQPVRPGGRWLGKKINLAFVIVALLALIDVGYNIYRLIYGLSPTISGEVFGLLGILILIGILELADITHFFAPTPQPLTQSQQLPPLGLAVGSVRAILALILLGLWVLLLIRGSSFITDANLLDRAVTTVGALVLTVIGFYFGSRTAQEK